MMYTWQDLTLLTTSEIYAELNRRRQQLLNSLPVETDTLGVGKISDALVKEWLALTLERDVVLQKLANRDNLEAALHKLYKQLSDILTFDLREQPNSLQKSLKTLYLELESRLPHCGERPQSKKPPSSPVCAKKQHGLGGNSLGIIREVKEEGYTTGTNVTPSRAGKKDELNSNTRGDHEAGLKPENGCLPVVVEPEIQSTVSVNLQQKGSLSRFSSTSSHVSDPVVNDFDPDLISNGSSESDSTPTASADSIFRDLVLVPPKAFDFGCSSSPAFDTPLSSSFTSVSSSSSSFSLSTQGDVVTFGAKNEQLVSKPDKMLKPKPLNNRKKSWPLAKSDKSNIHLDSNLDVKPSVSKTDENATSMVPVVRKSRRSNKSKRQKCVVLDPGSLLSANLNKTRLQRADSLSSEASSRAMSPTLSID